MTKALIMGGGLAGLSCGVALADRGIEVTVLEGGSRLGGRASSWRDETTGDSVDTGPPLYRQPDHRHPQAPDAGSPVPELCREHGISNATFYKWSTKFGGMDAFLMARMKELEDENRHLKKMYAEERLKAEIVAEALAKKW